MTASSYTGDPSNNLKDKVRYLIGDTDPTEWLLNDNEIEFTLTECSSDPYRAAVDCATAIGMKFVRKSDSSKTVGDLSISTQYGQRAKFFNELARGLRMQLARRHPPVPVSGSSADAPQFRIGQNDYPGVWPPLTYLNEPNFPRSGA